MKNITLLKRFLLPPFLVSLFYWIKYRCYVSPRAEVDYSSLVRIGKGTRISSFTKLKASDGPISIGEGVSFGTGCFISANYGGLEIGNDSMIGANCTVLAANYRYDRLDIPIHQQGTVSKGIRIGRDVWLGVGSVVMDGVTIGDGSIISPNSVVTSDIPELSIAQGNPAKTIFRRR